MATLMKTVNKFLVLDRRFDQILIGRSLQTSSFVGDNSTAHAERLRVWLIYCLMYSRILKTSSYCSFHKVMLSKG